MLSRTFPLIVSALCIVLSFPIGAMAVDNPDLLNDSVDISPDFHDFTNTYFFADSLASFDAGAASGTLFWERNRYFTRIAFNNMLAVPRPFEGITFPEGEYAVNPELPFAIEFITPRTVRIRCATGMTAEGTEPSHMLVGEPPRDDSWRMREMDGGWRYSSRYGSVTVRTSPWHLEFRDADGRLLTTTNHADDNVTTLTPLLPFSFVRRSEDYSRSLNAVFSLAPDEKIFGCGESFTRLNKRGQKVVLWVNDPNGVQTGGMHKPIPFFMSSRGYGMFIHTSTPVTCDFGSSFDGLTSLMVGDDELDLFVFLGTPKEILAEYTALTGRSPMPPLWSFGLWMSRISYFSEDEVREVAGKLRENRIPSDVIHIDTGWFETDWRCDYRFSESRFDDPERMIADLGDDGFHISLWQIPYFVPKNNLFPEIVDRGLAVVDGAGKLPYEDAILDFSNPDTVEWYREKIAGLLRMGVGAIKADFGEAGPLHGIYASGRTGFREHNLYPDRYNRVVAEVTREVTGENIIWARSAWAGSQRYPVHWGGDAGNTDTAMAASLRGGMSLGLSGFSFWSHDIGGFTAVTPEELYRRWLPFGMLTSHSRCHGAPPKEPWEYSPSFMDDFRRSVELKYRLMPYVYAQAKDCSERGLPMIRALFVEFPGDPGSWLVEDEYLFGSDILVAPLFETGTTGRTVYLPPGKWIDYQTGSVYDGGWHAIGAGVIPAVILVRDGAAIPHIDLAQSTSEMDWSELDLVVFSAEAREAAGKVCLPGDDRLHEVRLTERNGVFTAVNNPLERTTRLNVMSVESFRR